MRKTSLYLLLSAALLFWSTSAMAAVSGSCANCHTMHNSQNNSAVSAAGAKGSLTIGGCVGCHTGDNEAAGGGKDGTSGGGIPYVMDTADPTYGPEYSGGTLVANANTLAGGSFWWSRAAGDKTKGHNVTTDGLSAFDMDAPGRDAGQAEFTAGAPLTCAGTMGCHGNRGTAGDYASISGAHHGTATFASDYRWLAGVQGEEDNDWEYTVSNTDHNVYKAAARAEAATLNDDITTISSLCGQCHGEFHNGASTVSDGSAWLRHPTDYQLPAGEYQAYAGGEGGIYNVVAPVGVASLASLSPTTDLANRTDAVVTCISCHRAHGSPYADLLRWNYVTGTSAGTTTGGKANNGCFACHTSKD